jgi:hypothetical protein
MKRIKTAFFAICLVMLNVSNVFAQDEMPEPDGPPKGPPGDAPIDTYILYLVMTGVVLGMIIIQKSKIKKASM